MTDTLVDSREVCRRLAVGRVTLWRLVKAGRFPEPLHIGRAARWRESTVETFIGRLEAEQGRRRQEPEQ